MLNVYKREIRISKPDIGAVEIEAVGNVLKSGRLAQGAKVKEFEDAFAEFTDVKQAIAVSSGTAALHIALLAEGIGEGDEVITSPFTFISTANSILFVGAKPVFADIDEVDFNMDPEAVIKVITEKTKAIMPVHLYGQPADMSAMEEIAADHGLKVIEDACQAHGAEYEGRKVGSFGTGCFSFYATKNMTTGEGGMITTGSERAGAMARMIKNHGSAEKYVHEVIGYNMRMTEISAAIGMEQLKKLPEFIRRRQENAEYLSKRLKRVRGIITPLVKENRTHVFHLYTVKVTGEDGGVTRDELVRVLRDNGIENGIYYPIPVHKQPLYKKLGYEYRDKLPKAEKLSEEVLSLPIHPGVGREDLDYISEVIEGVMSP